MEPPNIHAHTFASWGLANNLADPDIIVMLSSTDSCLNLEGAKESNCDCWSGELQTLESFLGELKMSICFFCGTSDQSPQPMALGTCKRPENGLDRLCLKVVALHSFQAAKLVGPGLSEELLGRLGQPIHAGGVVICGIGVAAL
jgi:hypothetical protein